MSGTLTLKSSLDTAVHILNYRLSHATSPTTAAIFKFHLALLHSKITKTYKKVSSVVSPVSISSSRYSVLSVDSMDCDLDYTVPSNTASISQCFMTKHCKKIEERDTLLFTILFNKKNKYYTALFLSFLSEDMI